MALMAVCVACGVENSPMNTVCDVCKAPLGTALTEAAADPVSGPQVTMAISAAVTAGLGLLAWMFKLHEVTLAVAMFYGPLIASYRARENAVWHAALGGLLGLLGLLALSMPLSWEANKALLRAAIDGTPSTSTVIVLVFGILVLLATILPVSLVGASVGEHLAVRRRRRPSPPAATAAAVKLSDAELAKVDL